MSFTKIQNLLDTQLQTLVELPPLQLENTRNIGQTGVAFSRATLLPSRTTQVSLGVTGRDQLSGLYQVDLFLPMDTGVAAVNTLADAVIANFPRGLVLVDGEVNLHIVRAWREVGQRIEPFYMLPVVVQWSSIV